MVPRPYSRSRKLEPAPDKGTDVVVRRGAAELHQPVAVVQAQARGLPEGFHHLPAAWKI